MRLIDSDWLLDKLSGDDPANMEDYYYNAIKEAPTIEAEPVRHGEWVLLYGTYGPMVCSECGGEAPSVLMGSEYEESQYCPTCGAKMKMDGGEKG